MKNVGKGKIVIFSGETTERLTGEVLERTPEEEKTGIFDFKTWEDFRSEINLFYNQKRQKLMRGEMTIIHKVIKEISAGVGEDRLINITASISDYYSRLGIKTLYLRGKLTLMECEDCGSSWEIRHFNVEADKSLCPDCTSKYIRPKVLLKGESIRLYNELQKILRYLEDDSATVVILGKIEDTLKLDMQIKKYSCKKILFQTKEDENRSKELNQDLSQFDFIFVGNIEEEIIKIKQNILKG